MVPRPSIEAVILDRLLSGAMSVDFARDLFRQRELFLQNEAESVATFPGKFLAVVSGTLVVEDRYDDIIHRLRGEYAGQPFYLHKPDGSDPVMLLDEVAPAEPEIEDRPALPTVRRGSAASPDWTFTQRWPAIVAPGSIFPVRVRLTPLRPLKFATIAFEIPHGFRLEEGDLARTVHGSDLGRKLELGLWLRASSVPGRHGWTTFVRTAAKKGKSRRVEVPGRVAVRE